MIGENVLLSTPARAVASRVTVGDILDYLAGGISVQEILHDLTRNPSSVDDAIGRRKPADLKTSTVRVVHAERDRRCRYLSSIHRLLEH